MMEKTVRRGTRTGFTTGACSAAAARAAVLGLQHHIRIRDELVGVHAEVRQARNGQARADHFHIGHHRRAAAQHGGDASVHGLRVKVGETVEVEVRIRVDHAAHDGPLLCGVAVRLDLCVNDGKAVVLDGLARTRELFGDGVDGAHTGCPSAWTGWWTAWTCPCSWPCP